MSFDVRAMGMGWCGGDTANDGDALSDDDFEKEMEAELQRRAEVKGREAGIRTEGAGTSGEAEGEKEAKGEKEKKEAAAAYEDVYFDSDEEDGDEKKQRRAKVTDDDLLYDPNMDDDDQAYVDDLRRSFRPDLQASGSHLSQAQKAAKKASKGLQKLPNSDAVLNCPACFNVVCLDCQRHEVYKNQYRAMFVMNCVVDRSQKLKFPLQSGKKGKKGKKSKNQETETAVEDGGELFNPVKCEPCSTEIGVFDKDEVYHFFNVMASYS